VPLLQQAFDLDRNRSDVQRELQRRIKESTTPPPPPPRPVDPDPVPKPQEDDARAILAVIEQYRKAYEARSPEAVAQVAPFRQGLKKQFDAMNSYQMEISPDPPGISADRKTATVRCVITNHIKFKVGGDREYQQTEMFSMTKSGSTWIITNAVLVR